jgi:hypothetical protein
MSEQGLDVSNYQGTFVAPTWASRIPWQRGLRDGVDTDAYNGTATEKVEWIAGYATPAPVTNERGEV